MKEAADAASFFYFKCIIMYNWEELRDIVNGFIENLEFERDPHELYAPIRYTLSQSGKRVRPVLFLLAYNIAMPPNKRSPLPSGAGSAS